jgi:hypothetical protein
MDQAVLEQLVAKREAFTTKMKSLLAKVNPRINGNWLTITVTPTPEELKSLRDEFLELDELGIGTRVKFALAKANMKNSSNRYEVTDLAENIPVDMLLTASNFQVNRAIKWTGSDGQEQTATLNNFQISIFRGSVETVDLVVETFEVATE